MLLKIYLGAVIIAVISLLLVYFRMFLYRKEIKEVRKENQNKLQGSKTANTRQALIEYFKDKAEIMIATEAAAEGVNMQFCSFVINYDLPWNPQRIEQRIGRCHRYGQKMML